MPLPLIPIAISIVAGFIGEAVYDKVTNDQVNIEGENYDVQAFNGSEYAVIGMNDLTGAILLRSTKAPFDEVWKYPNGSYSRELTLYDDPVENNGKALRIAGIAIGTAVLYQTFQK